MFLTLYGMRDQPFGVTPDSRYLYPSPTHREALASLFCGVQDRRGFLALIAPPGTGKTTLLFYLLGRLRGTSRTAFLFDTPSDPQELMSSLATDIGLNTSGLGKAEIRQQVQRLLTEEASAGRNCVVVVDEAQNLSNPVLEEIRLLSNFESGTRKLLQVVLAGQPQLATRLSHPDLIQLRQRLAMVIRLEPLSAEQVRSYIDHRLKVAGYNAGQLFSDDAFALIARESQGIPRKINILCYNALAIGCAQKRKCIDVGIVRQAVGDLAFEQIASNSERIVARNCLSARGEPAPLQDEGAQDTNDSIADCTRRNRRKGSFLVNRVGSRFSTLTKCFLGTAVLLVTVCAGLSYRTKPGLRQGFYWTGPHAPAESSSLVEFPSRPISGIKIPTAVEPQSDHAPVVTDIRYFPGLMSTKVTINVDGPVRYAAHHISAPDRVYVDLYGTKLSPVLFGRRVQIENAVLRKIRAAEHGDKMTRVTLETRESCDYSIAVIPSPGRLIIELWNPRRPTNTGTSARN